MKKALILMAVLLLLVSNFAGCGKKRKNSGESVLSNESSADSLQTMSSSVPEIPSQVKNLTDFEAIRAYEPVNDHNGAFLYYWTDPEGVYRTGIITSADNNISQSDLDYIFDNPLQLSQLKPVFTELYNIEYVFLKPVAERSANAEKLIIDSLKNFDFIVSSQSADVEGMKIFSIDAEVGSTSDWEYISKPAKPDKVNIKFFLPDNYIRDFNGSTTFSDKNTEVKVMEIEPVIKLADNQNLLYNSDGSKSGEYENAFFGTLTTLSGNYKYCLLISEDYPGGGSAIDVWYPYRYLIQNGNLVLGIVFYSTESPEKNDGGQYLKIINTLFF